MIDTMLKQVDTKEVHEMIKKFEFNKILWLIREEIKKALAEHGIDENRINEVKKVNFELFSDSPGEINLDAVHFLGESDRHFDLSLLFGPLFNDETKAKGKKLRQHIEDIAIEGVKSRMITDDGLYHRLNVTEEPKCPVFFVETHD